jgi:hypothetical protein
LPDADAVRIGVNVADIPGEPERRVRNLNREQVEVGVRRQAFERRAVERGEVDAKAAGDGRKAAERTAPATWRRIGTLLDDFSPDECANYFVNSGYGSV